MENHVGAGGGVTGARDGVIGFPFQDSIDRRAATGMNCARCRCVFIDWKFPMGVQARQGGYGCEIGSLAGVVSFLLSSRSGHPGLPRQTGDLDVRDRDRDSSVYTSPVWPDVCTFHFWKRKSKKKCGVRCFRMRLVSVGCD